MDSASQGPSNPAQPVVTGFDLSRRLVIVEQGAARQLLSPEEVLEHPQFDSIEPFDQDRVRWLATRQVR